MHTTNTSDTMDTFRLVVFNTPGENPCRFRKATQSTLELREGQWWVALASVLRNFRPREKGSETIFIHCNLIEPTASGGAHNLYYELLMMIHL